MIGYVVSLVLVFLSPLYPMGKASLEKIPEIGVHTVTYHDLKRDRPVVVEVWYPTREKKAYDIAQDVWIHPKEVRDASPMKGRFPLILMSHGLGGDRRDRSWLVEHLVPKGFIIASIEHHGNSWKDYNLYLSLKFWDRAKDISFALSKVLREPFFRRRIDEKRIGFIGYSLGGMTGLSLAGAKAKNVEKVIETLQKATGEIDPEVAKRIDFAAAQGDFFDKRIRAMVLLSPAAFIFPPEALKEIDIPIGLVASKGDEVLLFEEHAQKVIEHVCPKGIKILPDGLSHYVFLNRASEKAKGVLKPDIQTKRVEKQKEKHHGEVGPFVSAFFQENL